MTMLLDIGLLASLDVNKYNWTYLGKELYGLSQPTLKRPSNFKFCNTPISMQNHTKQSL